MVRHHVRRQAYAVLRSPGPQCFQRLFPSELGSNPVFDELVLQLLGELRAGERRGLRPPKRIIDPRWVLHEMRLLKTEEEVEIMRKAAAITCEAHIEAMREAQPGSMPGRPAPSPAGRERVDRCDASAG